MSCVDLRASAFAEIPETGMFTPLKTASNNTTHRKFILIFFYVLTMIQFSHVVDSFLSRAQISKVAKSKLPLHCVKVIRYR